MTAAKKLEQLAASKFELISEEGYLAGELVSPIKHEYVDGMVYAMAGARNVHNLIASNTLIAVGSRLRGKPCRSYNSDTKVRIPYGKRTRFYYPDVSVTCRPNPPNDSYQDSPVLVVEVLSRKTRRFDDGEKRVAYQTIPTLRAYILIEQDMAAAVIYRRTDQGFVREVYQGMDAVLPLPEIEIDLPFVEIYEGVEFIPEVDPDQEELDWQETE